MTSKPNASQAIEALFEEIRRFPPPPEFAAKANARPGIYERAERDYLEFWASWARKLEWMKPFTQVLEWDEPFARWFGDARDQILKFPHSGFDDFVDTLSLIGLGLMKQVPARGKPKARQTAPAEFTLGWVKENSKRAEREARAAMDGW